MSEYPEDVMKAARGIVANIRADFTGDGRIDDATAEKEEERVAHAIARAIMAERRKWQDIRTAPIDGSPFLAYDVRTGKMDVCEMRDTSTGRPYVMTIEPNQEYGPEPHEFGYDSADIKFWMPLPTPPSFAASSSEPHPSELEPDQRQRSCTEDEA